MHDTMNPVLRAVHVRLSSLLVYGNGVDFGHGLCTDSQNTKSSGRKERHVPL